METEHLTAAEATAAEADPFTPAAGDSTALLIARLVWAMGITAEIFA